MTVIPNGPLYLRGDIEITTPDETVLLVDTRVGLCRCGASANKPLCDNSHKEIDFQDDGTVERIQSDGSELLRGTLQVIPTPDGPVLLSGGFELRDGDERPTHRGANAALCRCGSSQNKPFCDGTHDEIGFSSDDEVAADADSGN